MLCTVQMAQGLLKGIPVKSSTGHRFENNSVCLTPTQSLQQNWTLISIRSVMHTSLWTKLVFFRCTLCPTPYVLLLCTRMRSQAQWNLAPELSPHGYSSNMKGKWLQGQFLCPREQKGLYSRDDTEISQSAFDISSSITQRPSKHSYCSGLGPISKEEAQNATFCPQPQPVHTQSLTSHPVFSQ